MSGSAEKPSGGPSQEEVDDILGAALDSLDAFDDDDNNDDQPDDQHQAEVVPLPSSPTPAVTSTPAPAEPKQTPKKVYYGPEPPPPPGAASVKPAASAAAAAASSASSPSASLEDAMAQLLRAGEAIQSGDGNNIDLDGAEKMLEELMGQLQLGGLSGDGGNANATQNGGSASSNDSQKKKKNGNINIEGGDARAKTSATSGPSPKASSEAGRSTGYTSSSAAAAASPGPEADVDRAVKRLLSDMAKASSDDIPNMDAMDGSQMGEMGEEMMESMMKELSAFGASDDADDVVDGMMKQLLSKDLMYDPMKQVCDRFPAWLAENKGHLSEEEYQKYGTQYQYFQRIVHVYETDPENFPRLMELMQDIQEYGQPPADIIKELAPGLEFDEEGMPKMDGQGMLPGMPPFAPGDEQCSIM